MQSTLILFCYNRPKILKACIETLFGNTKYEFDDVLFINDGSSPETSKGIADFILQNQGHYKTSFNLMHFGKNIKYGNTAEFAFDYVRWKNPKYFFFIEQDYVFRPNWAEEAIAVLEASPKTIALSGYSNPDFFNKEKTDVIFPKIIKEDYGFDPCKREFMYKPFKLKTTMGEIEVQGSSNSCGCSIINWGNIIKISKYLPDYWEKVIEYSYNKNGDRKYFWDGRFSHGNSWYWYEYYKSNDADFEREFPWLDICDYSISDHKNGMGLNGGITTEGSSFVSSPKWHDSYINLNPRLN